MKKDHIFYTVAGNDENMEYARMMVNSLKKFHPDSPIKIFDAQDIAERGGMEQNYYKLTPLIARELITEYKTVVRLDADQIILGDLNYVLTMPYDIGTVLNINRVDPAKYGYIGLLGNVPNPQTGAYTFLVRPNEYYNCGFVSMRSEDFVEHWWELCNSPFYDRLQYREQDLLNYLTTFGRYKTLCFDNFNLKDNYYAWHGLCSKGEWHRAIMKDDDVILPKGEDNHPDRDVVLKCIHWASGGNEKKMNYKAFFSPSVSKRIDYLVSA